MASLLLNYAVDAKPVVFAALYERRSHQLNVWVVVSAHNDW